jgi:hypothetical protein
LIDSIASVLEWFVLGKWIVVVENIASFVRIINPKSHFSLLAL